MVKANKNRQRTNDVVDDIAAASAAATIVQGLKMRRGFELNTIPGNAHVLSSPVMMIIIIISHNSSAHSLKMISVGAKSATHTTLHSSEYMRRTEIDIGTGGMCEAEHHT